MSQPATDINTGTGSSSRPRRETSNWRTSCTARVVLPVPGSPRMTSRRCSSDRKAATSSAIRALVPENAGVRPLGSTGSISSSRAVTSQRTGIGTGLSNDRSTASFVHCSATLPASTSLARSTSSLPTATSSADRHQTTSPTTSGGIASATPTSPATSTAAW
jgi:hypothetical protein